MIFFHVGRREIGHLHGDRLADLPVPVRIREQLVAAGKASRALPASQDRLDQLLHQRRAGRWACRRAVPVELPASVAGKRPPIPAGYFFTLLTNSTVAVRLSPGRLTMPTSFSPLTVSSKVIVRSGCGDAFRMTLLSLIVPSEIGDCRLMSGPSVPVTTLPFWWSTATPLSFRVVPSGPVAEIVICQSPVTSMAKAVVEHHQQCEQKRLQLHDFSLLTYYG